MPVKRPRRVPAKTAQRVDRRAAPEGPGEAAALDGVEAERTPHRAICPVVGIGASAGGLEAFERFFERMPAENGLAFVLVPHLDTHHRSPIVELGCPSTAMATAQA